MPSFGLARTASKGNMDTKSSTNHDLTYCDAIARCDVTNRHSSSMKAVRKLILHLQPMFDLWQAKLRGLFQVVERSHRMSTAKMPSIAYMTACIGDIRRLTVSVVLNSTPGHRSGQSDDH